MYGIVKKSRIPQGHSYTGISWRSIGVSNPPSFFLSFEEAQSWAQKLGEVNLVGFEVFKFGDDDESL